jgi:hypothetical protein
LLWKSRVKGAAVGAPSKTRPLLLAWKPSISAIGAGHQEVIETKEDATG